MLNIGNVAHQSKKGDESTKHFIVATSIITVHLHLTL